MAAEEATILFLVVYIGSSLIQIDSALPCQTIGFFAVVIHSVSPFMKHGIPLCKKATKNVSNTMS